MAHPKKILGLFPGQGSQKVGMGRALCESSARANEIFERANHALGFDLRRLCFEGPAEELTRTAIAQPAILTVSVIAFELANARWGESLNLVAAAGHSLGEYSALVASGALSFDDAVVLVHKRGLFMQEAVPVGAGKMLAVIGMDVSALEAACAEVSEGGHGVVEIANVNDATQIVVAGNAASVDALVPRLTGSRTVELAVSAPFHCSLMRPAAERLKKELEAVQVYPSRFPVYTNFAATPSSTPDDVRASLFQQVCGRVRWVECMQNSISATCPDLAVEFGSGAVLTGLLRRIKKDLPRANADSPEAIDALLGPANS